jgi:hypothetical protein
MEGSGAGAGRPAALEATRRDGLLLCVVRGEGDDARAPEKQLGCDGERRGS